MENTPELPGQFKPLFDYPIRDTSICLGDDGYYYLTGTTGFPDWWAVTGDIQIWKSADLQDWTPVIMVPRKRSTVWNIDRNGSWQKEIGLRDGAPFRPLWAPEIHYIKGTYWVTYSIPRLGNGLLRSVSGRAEGPYVDHITSNLPISQHIDASLFQDDDGEVYFLCDNGKIARMNEDMTALAEELRVLTPANAGHVGFEGTFLFKAYGRYHLAGAEFVDGDYHCFAASAEHVYGPYGDRYLAIPHGGHNMFFQDKEGQWWSTFFGNNANAPFRERPGALKVEFDEQLRIRPMLHDLIRKNDGGSELTRLNLNHIASPVLLEGNDQIAYRDPAAIYLEGVFRLYYTLVETESDGKVYMYTAMSQSDDLVQWTQPKRLTPKDRSLNFSSPGNIVRFRDRWIMCLQTYPRPNGEKYGSQSSRIWVMESSDLDCWSWPELLRLKGEQVPVEEMGRMIDPYLIESKDEPGKWFCFYKQNGVSISYSYDLKHWTYYGNEKAGENVCILQIEDQYVMLHSPENGIGIMRSFDLRNWTHDDALLTLGQQEWAWARGRITAGFVLDCRQVAGIEKFLLFFHGSGPQDERVIFDTHACIGIAWSDDLLEWHWPESS